MWNRNPHIIGIFSSTFKNRYASNILYMSSITKEKSYNMSTNFFLILILLFALYLQNQKALYFEN